MKRKPTKKPIHKISPEEDRLSSIDLLASPQVKIESRGGRKGEGTGAKGNMLRKHNKRPVPCLPSDGLEWNMRRGGAESRTENEWNQACQ